MEGVKGVRDLKYLIEQLPYCAPSSSDSPSCAGHKLMSPEDVTGICFSFAPLLTARHSELWLPQKPDLLTLAQQLCCSPRAPWLPDGGVLCTQGCVHSFRQLAPKVTPLGSTVLAGGWCHPCVVRLDVYRLQSHSILSPTLRAKTGWLNRGE